MMRSAQEEPRSNLSVSVLFCEDEGPFDTTCPLKKEVLEKRKMSTGSDNVVGTYPVINKTDDEDCQYASCWAALKVIRDEHEWLLDSGAIHHICGTEFALQNECACNLFVTIANGRTIQSTTCGTIVMEINVNGNQTKILLQDVHVTPGLRKNLLSIGKIVKKIVIPHLLSKAHHCTWLKTRESNLLLAVQRGTMYFATFMGMKSNQLLRVSQRKLMTTSWNGMLESAMSTLRL